MPAAVSPSGEPDVYMNDEDDNVLPTAKVNKNDTALSAKDVHEDDKVQQVDPQLSNAALMVDADNSELPFDDDDNVTEYSFKSEDYVHESELEDDDDDDARSHISLSSTDEPEVPSVHDVVWQDLSPSERVNYERMIFGNLPQEPLNGSWSFTEDYQAEVDQMCINYTKIFSPNEWLIPAHEAHAIVDGMLDRLRKRAAGVLIFAPRQAANMGQPMQQPPTFAQHQHHHQQQQQQQQYYQQQQFQNGGMLMGMHPGPMRGTYMPPQGYPGMPRQLMMNDPNTRGGFRNAPPTMITRPPLNGPTPPYPTRERPDFRKTVGKSAGRGGKTRRQAETDEFPWNRQLDFTKAKADMKTDPTWDYSVYDKTTIDSMNGTRAKNGPILANLELGITMKQKQSRNGKGKNAKENPDASSEDDGGGEDDAERPVEVEEDGEGGLRIKGGRKKAGEAGSDPYHSGNFAFATDADANLAASMGMHSPEMLIEAGETDKLPLDKLSAIKICWSPGKKGNSQALEQAVFTVKDTVVTRKMLAKTPVITHRAAECIIDFCPDLLWRDILLRILSESSFSNKQIRERACLNGSWSDRATIAKRLGAALGKDTNPPRGEGKEAALDWCETNRDDFDNYQAFFGKRPAARRTAQGRKKRLANAKPGESEGDDKSPSKDGEGSAEKKKPSAMAVDGAATDESAREETEDDDDAVSLQDSDDLDAMSD